MCGIVGIIGQNNEAAPILIEGLKRLEYRGYDSAGIATLHNGQIERRRAEGKLVNLEDIIKNAPISGRVGIGHTRWATHGLPTASNAHPHATEKVSIVHNGIIENYQTIKDMLIEKGHQFESETDSEVIAHLISDYLDQGLGPKDAAFKAFDDLEGAFAISAVFAAEDDLMIGVRQGTPLAIGYGDGQMFLASDSYALAPLTKKISFLEDGDRVILRHNMVEIIDATGKPQERDIRITAQSGDATDKGNYDHFMLKEIHEQPSVIGDTLNSFINPSTGMINFPNADILKLSQAPKITLIACGTASYACLTAKYWLEKVARIPCDVDFASEFRYREAPLPENGAAIFVSQSGETLDTLEALRYCKREKQTILSIVNTIESTIERESDHVLHTLAGPEIGVASTKAFTTQLSVLACLTIALASEKGLLNEDQHKELVKQLTHLPAATADILKDVSAYQTIGKDLAKSDNILYLGRGANFPIAMEGALKIKEISYIHAEGLAAGEMKHGHIALIDETMPVVVVAPSKGDPLFEKTLGNVQETIARKGKVLMVSDETGVKRLSGQEEWSLTMEDCHPFITPILYTIPMQLLAYYTAIERGTDVDQPRNLAKSVTVE